MFFLHNLSARDVFIDIPKSDFNSIAFHIIKNSRFSRKKDAFKKIIAREDLGTTAIGNNIAIPHCRLKDFRGFYVKFALFKGRLGYIAPNGEEIRFIFLIVGSEDDTGYYLRALAHIAKIMQMEDIRGELMQAKDKAAVRKIFLKYENMQLDKVGAWK